MQLIPALRLVIFIGIILAVYLAAAVMLFRSLAGRIRGRRPTFSQRWTRRVVFSAAILGLLCFAYGYYVEPYWPQVKRVRIPTEKMPAGSRPIRIAHLADFHCDPRPRLEEKIPGIVERERPDLIVFTGDAINSAEAMPILKRLLARLAEIAPTFAVRGNWDVWRWSDRDLFGDTGVRELDGESSRLEVNGVPVFVAGVAVGSDDRVDEALRSIPAGALTVFLHHYPDLIPEISRRPVDLYCAAHTHGGQVALPIYGALVTLSRFDKTYESGLYRVGGTWLYVNRGIGMEGGPAPRVRFWARPEITILELMPPD